MKILNFKLIAFSLFAILGFAVFLTSCEQEELSPQNTLIEEMGLDIQSVKLGERIINEYIDDNAESLKRSVTDRKSGAYSNFLFSVDIGDYPGLTGEKSKYVKSSKDIKAVRDFIKLELERIYGDLPPEYDQDMKEMQPLENGKSEPDDSSKSGSYNRYDAKDYALDWAYDRNSDYPDFSTAGGGGDCTNFVSQAIYHGGLSMSGSGDGCKHENNYAEWYVESGGSNFCFGNWSSWEWSTPWSTTWPFRYYHSTHTNNATTLGWTTSASTADWYLRVGDVVQIQQKNNQNQWRTAHTMIVTGDISNDLLVSYHTEDERNKELSDIYLGNDKRFVLVKF